jgi:serine protease Do
MNPTRIHSKLPFLTALVLLLAMPAAGSASLPNFSDLVEKASPAVVNISTTQKRTVHSRLPEGLEIPDLPEDSPFGELFRHFFGEEGGGTLPRQRETASLGSGFIITEDGYVLTNYHVVEGAEEILVRTSDYAEYEAEVVGGDKRSDIALIKIAAEGLPALETGSSKDLKVGEWVLAIGSPFGFDHSATAGIVSAKGRNLPSENYVPFIQTDVAINPGNSGGPLFDLDGKVVGVNSQIYSRTGGFMGLSFAIPIEVAMNVAEQLRTTGRVSRGWIGVLIQDVNRELAESFGMDHPSGALIAQILPGGPAEAAGLQVGDVILTYNGTEVKNSAKLPPLVGASPVNRPAKLELMRDGKRRSMEIVIGELPADNETVTAMSKPVPGKASRLGLTVAPLGEEQRAELEIERDAGVLVEEVKPGPAQAAGIRQGDVILKLGGDWVKSVDQFGQLSKELPGGRSVAVLVQRGKGPLFLALRLPE